MEESSSTKLQIYTKSMSTEVSKLYAQIPVFLAGNNEFNRLLRKFSGFLKLPVAWNISILQSSFYMH